MNQNKIFEREIKSLKSKCYYSLGTNYMELRDLKKSIIYIEKDLNYCTKRRVENKNDIMRLNEYYIDEGKSYVNLGLSHFKCFNKNDYNQCEKMYKKAEECFINSKSTSDLEDLKENLSVLKESMKISKRIEMNDVKLKGFIKIKDNNNLLECLDSLIDDCQYIGVYYYYYYY